MEKRVKRVSLLTAIALFAGSYAFCSSATADELVERGAYLVNALAACANCHTPRAGDEHGAYLSGGNRFGPADKAVYAPNITPDASTGIGTWSDRQIIDAIRNQTRPDGSHIGPPMPQSAFRTMSDADVTSIVAFLRTVPPIQHDVPHGEHMAREHMASLPRTVYMPEPAEADRGRYIANTLAHCTECHTPANASPAEFMKHIDEGGRIFQTADGPLVAPGITRKDLERFTDDELASIIMHGLRPDGSKLKGPMPVAAYANMKPEDLRALIAYLRQ